MWLPVSVSVGRRSHSHPGQVISQTRRALVRYCIVEGTSVSRNFAPLHVSIVFVLRKVFPSHNLCQPHCESLVMRTLSRVCMYCSRRALRLSCFPMLLRSAFCVPSKLRRSERNEVCLTPRRTHVVVILFCWRKTRTLRGAASPCDV